MFRVFAALSLVLVPGLILCDKPPEKVPEKVPDKPAEIKLFDGKTLKNWTAADFFGAGKVDVKDGCIVMEKGKIMTGATYTGKDFPKVDYEVTFEGKRIEGKDFFCTTTFPVEDSFCSLVVGGWSGRVVGLSNVDSEDASVNVTNTTRDFKTDQWYRFRLRVGVNRIQAWIDKDQVVDLDTSERRLSIRIECNLSKPFGFATYKTTGAVRDVRLRKLTAEEIKELNTPKKDDK
jgi:hypothetical protein